MQPGDPTKDSIALIKGDPSIHFCACAHIKMKDGAVRKPEIPNALQIKLFAAYLWLLSNGLPINIIILKPRQSGGSEGTAELCYHHSRRFNVGGFMMADQHDRTDKIWSLFCNKAGPAMDAFEPYWGNTFKSNTEQATITYKDERGLTCKAIWDRGTANDTGAGAAGTRQVLWLSESARYAKNGAFKDTDVIGNALNSIPSDMPHTMRIAESTGEGSSGWHHDTFEGGVTLDERRAGKVGNGWVKVFVGTHECSDYTLARLPQHNEYFDDSDGRWAEHAEEEQAATIRYRLTPEQIAWRRRKIVSDLGGDAKLYKRDYPYSPEECVAGHVRVGTDAGVLPICDVLPGTASDHGEVVARMAKGTRKTIRVTTKSGHSLECTPDHLIAKADGSFEQAEKTLGSSIRLQPPVFSGSEVVIRWEDFATVHSSLRITKDWALFLGFFMGDGSYSGKTLSVVCDDKDHTSFVVVLSLLARLFGPEAVTHRKGYGGNCSEARINRQSLTPIFERLGLLKHATHGERADNHHCRKVNVPECIWRSPKTHIALFLRGLYDADGWIPKDGRSVRFYTKHLEFAQDVQLLLLGFQIRSAIHRVTTRKKDGREFYGYELAIYAKCGPIFMAEIGFVSARKSAAWQERSGRGKPPMDYGTTDTVVSIEEAGEQPVYDLSIEGEHVFSAGGILVHNCWSASGSKRFNVVAVANMLKASEHLWKRTMAGDQNAPKLGSLQGGPGGIVWMWTRENAWLWVKEEPKYERRYAIVVDPMTGEQAAGSEKTDNHAVGVMRHEYIEKESGVLVPAEVVAVIHVASGCKWDMDVLADRAALLARWYGNCIVIPEVNKGMDLIPLLKARNVLLYMRQARPDLQNPSQRQQAVGFYTSTSTRNMWVSAAAEAIREGTLLCDYWPAIREFDTFIVNSSGKAEAAPGTHDDFVAMYGIGKLCIAAATAMRAPVVRSFPRNQAMAGMRGSGALS